jgi:hypothetical protein
MSGLTQMQMNEKSARQFGASLAFLSKNGRDVTMEATADGVVLRSLNDAKNAFAAVHFQRGAINCVGNSVSVSDVHNGLLSTHPQTFLTTFALPTRLPRKANSLPKALSMHFGP